MDFVYATLEPSHADEWLVLRLEGVREFPLGFLVTEAEALKMDAKRAAEILSARTVRGVFSDRNLIGFCGFRREQLEQTQHRAELGPFFVASEYQGSGAADTLMKGIITEAESIGVEQLELFVDTENARALRFYLRHGFEIVATHPDGVRIAGQKRDDYFCRKRLQRN